MTKARSTETVWDRARRCDVDGIDPMGVRETLDPGVNFFVLALRHLGAKTQWSCEGHPEGFYVSFICSEKLARRIRSWGYFSVHLGRGPSEYLIRLGDVYEFVSNKKPRGTKMVLVPWKERSKSGVLRSAAIAWWKVIGPFPIPEGKVLVRAPALRKVGIRSPLI